ncbi:HNH endonuclease [Cohaesibacter gelatinilyticus]|uniref:Putative HNH nuclease YajD n=1 Tax=Cohaesibacter gelatinilyticus TaxID=372072 RepID=A0A285PJW8_9HYPH|nr:HNH endonuclease signature motif containing protein [Cohaesibacter gelatinilyticus]SNZ21708.1 HNH endonuclease [Cohaesibacter gelatinilyticus]
MTNRTVGEIEALPGMEDYNSRTQWQSLYKTKRWKTERKQFLEQNPLCVRCHERGKVTPATVVDHIKAHKGNLDLFWDWGNWQGLCQADHNSWKQSIEARGYSTQIGPDGFPIDPRHPSNK